MWHMWLSMVTDSDQYVPSLEDNKCVFFQHLYVALGRLQLDVSAIAVHENAYGETVSLNDSHRDNEMTPM